MNISYDLIEFINNLNPEKIYTKKDMLRVAEEYKNLLLKNFFPGQNIDLPITIKETSDDALAAYAWDGVVDINSIVQNSKQIYFLTKSEIQLDTNLWEQIYTSGNKNKALAYLLHAVSHEFRHFMQLYAASTNKDYDFRLENEITYNELIGDYAKTIVEDCILFPHVPSTSQYETVKSAIKVAPKVLGRDITPIVQKAVSAISIDPKLLKNGDNEYDLKCEKFFSYLLDNSEIDARLFANNIMEDLGKSLPFDPLRYEILDYVDYAQDTELDRYYDCMEIYDVVEEIVEVITNETETHVIDDNESLKRLKQQSMEAYITELKVKRDFLEECIVCLINYYEMKKRAYGDIKTDLAPIFKGWYKTFIEFEVDYAAEAMRYYIPEDVRIGINLEVVDKILRTHKMFYYDPVVINSLAPKTHVKIFEQALNTNNFIFAAKFVCELDPEKVIANEELYSSIFNEKLNAKNFNRINQDQKEQIDALQKTINSYAADLFDKTKA